MLSIHYFSFIIHKQLYGFPRSWQTKFWMGRNMFSGENIPFGQAGSNASSILFLESAIHLAVFWPCKDVVALACRRNHSPLCVWAHLIGRTSCASRCLLHTGLLFSVFFPMDSEVLRLSVGFPTTLLCTEVEFQPVRLRLQHMALGLEIWLLLWMLSLEWRWNWKATWRLSWDQKWTWSVNGSTLFWIYLVKELIGRFQLSSHWVLSSDLYRHSDP